MATKTAAVDAKGYRKFGFRDVLAYGLGDFGCNMSFALKGTLTIFWTQYMGIDSILMASLLLLVQVWDAINDPVIGAMVDADKTVQAQQIPCLHLGRFCRPAGGRRSVLRALDRRSLRCKVHSVRGRLYPVGCVLHRCQRSLRLHAFSDHGGSGRACEAFHRSFRGFHGRQYFCFCYSADADLRCQQQSAG